MSTQSHRREIQRIQHQLDELDKFDSMEAQRELSKSRELARVQQRLLRSPSELTKESLHRHVLYINGELDSIRSKRADNMSKRIRLNEGMSEAKRNLDTVQRWEEDLETDLKRLQQMKLQELTEELQQMRRAGSGSISTDSASAAKQYDAFICHATEDKDDFVRPLVQALHEAGHAIWYDEFTMKVGDSLRQSIDKGLANSRYGIVILSSAFFQKNWPQYELNGLAAMEMQGRKVILPIWHKVSVDEVMAYSPPLADKVALNSSMSSIGKIVQQLGEVLAP